MNTSPHRDYAALGARYSPLAIEVVRWMDQLHAAFVEAFPGSDFRHHALFRREWASLASVPYAPIENADLTFSVTDQDARRLILMAEAMLRRIADVQAGQVPRPKWAVNHAAPKKGSLGQMENIWNSGSPRRL